MSTPSRRGRKVPPKQNTQSMGIFYALIGGIAVFGVAMLIYYANANETTKSEIPLPTAVSHDTTDVPTKTITTTKTTTTTTEAKTLVPDDPKANEGTVVGGFYYKGSPDAPVTVIEYSDFQCPACGSFATSSLYRQLNIDYIEQNKVHFIFHDFPLPYHDNAPIASEAARCAGEQGSYWQMHDVLFERQSQWSEGSTPKKFFIQFAGEIGLDGNQFTTCLDSGKYAGEVEAAFQAAMKAQIPATPTFIVNGKQVNATMLEATIDAVLKQKGQ